MSSVQLFRKEFKDRDALSNVPEVKSKVKASNRLLLLRKVPFFDISRQNKDDSLKKKCCLLQVVAFTLP